MGLLPTQLLPTQPTTPRQVRPIALLARKALLANQQTLRLTAPRLLVHPVPHHVRPPALQSARLPLHAQPAFLISTKNYRLLFLLGGSNQYKRELLICS